MKEPWCLAAAATHKLVCRARDQEGDAGPRHLGAHVIIEEGVAEKVLKQARTALRKEAALAILPDDLRDQVHAALVERPELSWDLAVSAVVGGEEPE